MVDIGRDLREVSLQSNKPLIDQILAIQGKGVSSEGKGLRWRFIEEIPRNVARPGRKEIQLRYVLSPVDRYIAVSCPWELPTSENQAMGKSRIRMADDIEIKMPEDVVLDRVVRFAALKGYPFWLDKLCIDQSEDSEELPIAIQSMDLVYKESTITLGLLFARIDSMRDIISLSTSLQGSLIVSAHQSSVRSHVLVATLKDARAALDICFRITEDPWWDRAWIFQEEYLSGLRMELLIRHSLHDRSTWFEMFGNLPRELQINAVGFRDEATKLCQAILHSERASQRDKKRCTAVLKKAGKYNVLLSQGAAMSPIILEEIGRRGISAPWDLLPIACNACDYAVRLDARKLQGHPDVGSMSLAILTTYILNGEILDHRISTNSGHNIFQFLKRSTLRVNPPLGGEKALTFVKHCRFPAVVLSSAGIKTEGILWKLGKRIRLSHSFMHDSTPEWIVKKFKRSLRPRKFNYSLTEDEMWALWRLVGYLRYGEQSSYATSAKHLIHFLEKIAPLGYDDDWTYWHLMSIMATNLAYAIQGERQPHLGWVASSAYSPYQAIFVTDSASSPDLGFAFTSWVCSQTSTEQGFLKQDCSKYVSLEVGQMGERDGGRTTITPQRWINGLCFFSNNETTKVTIPWHDSITSLNTR